MPIGTPTKEIIFEAVEKVIKQFGANTEELIPILNGVNKEIGFLPEEALDQISKELHLPKSRVYSVASFYHMLSLKPRGRHTIKFCESAPCHVAGSQIIWETLQELLDLKPGESTEDGKWTLTTTNCLGACGVGPVIVIDDDIYGNLDPDQLPEILARYD